GSRGVKNALRPEFDHVGGRYTVSYSTVSSRDAAPASPDESVAHMLWIGVDVGGTFTDLVAVDSETGEMRVAKRPSTPARPDEAVLGIVQAVCGDGDVASARAFIHGTTVGLNALLQRDHEGLALLTTRGFRDVLEIRRGDRGELYNLFWHPPAPLVSRRLR